MVAANRVWKYLHLKKIGKSVHKQEVIADFNQGSKKTKNAK